jgi:hypothetical protein
MASFMCFDSSRESLVSFAPGVSCRRKERIQRRYDFAGAVLISRFRTRAIHTSGNTRLFAQRCIASYPSRCQLPRLVVSAIRCSYQDHEAQG